MDNMDDMSAADRQSRDLERAQAALNRVRDAEKSNVVELKKSSDVVRRDHIIKPAPPARRNLSRKKVLEKKIARKEASWTYGAGSAFIVMGLLMGSVPMLVVGLLFPLYQLIFGPVEVYNKSIKEWSKQQAAEILSSERSDFTLKAAAITALPDIMMGREARKLEKAVQEANPHAKKELILNRRVEIALPLTSKDKKDQQRGLPVANSSLLISDGEGEQITWVELSETEVWLEAVDNALEL